MLTLPVQLLVELSCVEAEVELLGGVPNAVVAAWPDDDVDVREDCLTADGDVLGRSTPVALLGEDEARLVPSGVVLAELSAEAGVGCGVVVFATVDVVVLVPDIWVDGSEADEGPMLPEP